MATPTLGWLYGSLLLLIPPAGATGECGFLFGEPDLTEFYSIVEKEDEKMTTTTYTEKDLRLVESGTNMTFYIRDGEEEGKYFFHQGRRMVKKIKYKRVENIVYKRWLVTKNEDDFGSWACTHRKSCNWY